MAKTKETAAVAVADNEVPFGQDLVPTVDFSHFAEDAGDLGFSRDDLAVPFLKVLQSLSPQVQKREAEYIPGAEEGMILNSVTQEVYPGDPGIVVIPVMYAQSFTEWKPKRGGFVKDHGSDASILSQTTKNDQNDDVLPSGNTIQSAGMYYVLVYNEVTGDVTQAVLSLTGTAQKQSRKWNTLISSVNITDPKTKRRFAPAMFYMAYRMSTVYNTNDHGSWFTPEFKPFKPTVELGPTGPDVYMAARNFKALISEGAVTVKHEQQGNTKSDADEAF